MYCRNCGNEVNEKAVACPKCGVNPRTEKHFCPNCGVATKENQVLCTSCGVSLAAPSLFDAGSKLVKDVDWPSLLKKRPLILALVALLGCMLPWSEINVPGLDYLNKSYSFFQISKMVEELENSSSGSLLHTGSILHSYLLALLPLSLVAIILSYFVPAVEKYKKLFAFIPILVVSYFIIGIYLLGKDMTDQIARLMPGGVINEASSFAQANSRYLEKFKDVFSIGLGFYLTVISSVLILYFSRKEQ